MDANKAEIKNIGNKLTDEEGTGNKDMSKELENLNIIVDDKKLPVITIKEKDIELLKSELDITYEEAKLQLIKYQGNLKKVLDTFIKEFKFY